MVLRVPCKSEIQHSSSPSLTTMELNLPPSLVRQISHGLFYTTSSSSSSSLWHCSAAVEGVVTVVGRWAWRRCIKSLNSNKSPKFPRLQKAGNFQGTARASELYEILRGKRGFQMQGVWVVCGLAGMGYVWEGVCG